MINQPKYIHCESVHNFKAAKEVVPTVVNLIAPKSVIDVGCGTGTWLKIFNDFGVTEVHGIDGDYIDRSMLAINENDFTAADLEKKINFDKQYCLVLCLEVAEHLSINASDVLVDSLCALGNTIIFSAAITNQGGQNHINEQPPIFWIEKFAQKGFEVFDILRPIFWNNENVDSWYRQNMLLFTKDDYFKTKFSTLKTFDANHIVHPNLSLGKDKLASNLNKQVLRITNGNMKATFYISILFAKFKRKFFNFLNVS
jgi:SAM-dependent methyltransferase